MGSESVSLGSVVSGDHVCRILSVGSFRGCRERDAARMIARIIGVGSFRGAAGMVAGISGVWITTRDGEPSITIYISFSSNGFSRDSSSNTRINSNRNNSSNSDGTSEAT